MNTEIARDESRGSPIETATPLFDNGGRSSLPWNREEFYPEPPRREAGWGYVIKRLAYSCTFEELRSQLAQDRGRRIKLIWSPSTSRMLPPEEVPELLADVRQRNLLSMKHRLRRFLLIAAILASLAACSWSSAGAGADVPFISYFFLPLVFGIIPAIAAAWELRRSGGRELTFRDALNAGQQVRYRYWLHRQRAPFTVSFIAALLLVALAQINANIQYSSDEIWRDERWSAIDAAGLVKPAVWQGEVWRLFTSTVLHGGIWHLLFNLLALYVFGKMLEVLVGRAYLPVVFFFSALGGSVLSLLLVPATSVGSSGGIMGIIGFLAVLGYYNRPNLPPGFLKPVLGTIAYVAFLGPLFVIVDNAGHAGGAVCGALLGYTLLPRRPTALPLTPPPGVKVLAVLCTAGLIASVLGSIMAMFAWR